MSLARLSYRFLLFVTAAWSWLACAAPAAAQVKPPVGELRFLRVLIVLDTDDEYLRAGLKVDEWRLRHALAQTIPKGRYDLQVLTGEKARAGAVLAYYRGLKTRPDEGLLFFYGGHGAIDPTKGPFFKFEKGPVLFRKDVLAAMEAKKTGLVVLLSDCCSNRIPVKVLTNNRGAPSPATSLQPTAAALLFRTHGTVDVTAAQPDKTAYGDLEKGGLFTRAFCKLLVRNPKDLGAGADDLDWKRFYTVLRKEMRINFPLWRKEMVSRSADLAALITDNSQEPHAYRLPGGKGSFPGDGSAAPAEKARLVVSVKNNFDKPITYSYRWTGESSWRKKSLAKGEREVHHVAVKPGAAEAKLELRIEGEDQMHLLASKRWVGVGSPTLANAARYVLSPDN